MDLMHDAEGWDSFTHLNLTTETRFSIKIRATSSRA
jgi:hypothetical protein